MNSRIRLWWLIALFLMSCISFCSGITLRFAVWDGDEALRALRVALQEFEKANPGISVEIEPVAWGNYQEKLLAQIAAGVAPDVAMMDPANFQRYAKRDVIYPLDELYAQDTSFDLSAYYPPIVEAMSYGGHLYVLPRDIAPIGLIYYNKSLFDKASIPYPDGSWTWDFQVRPQLRDKDFIWVMQQLTRKDDKGRVLRYGFSPGWPQAIADVFTFSQGARYVDNGADINELTLTDQRVVRAFQWVQDLQYKHRFMPSQLELNTSLMASVTDLFVQGKVAMMQSGIWEVPNLRKKLIPGTKNFFEWDIVMAPAYKDGTRAMPTGGSGYCIVKQTKHPEAAWKLVKWMAGKPGMDAMAAAGIAQPAISDLARSQPWIPGPEAPAIERYPANRILTDEAVPYVVFEPTSDVFADLRTQINPSMDRIWSGTASAESALKQAQDAATLRLQTLQTEQSLPAFPWFSGLLLSLVLVVALALWVYWPERKVRRTNKERAESKVAYLFIAPWLVGLFLFTLGPMLLSFLMSFSDWDIIQPAKWRAGANYTEAFQADPKFLASLTVTTIYTIVSVPLGIIVALLLALLLNTKINGMPLFRTFFYLPSLASGVAIALIWKSVFKADGGLINTIIYGADGQGNLLGIASLLRPLSPDGMPLNWLGNEKTALAALILMSLWGAGGGMVVLLAGLQGVPELYYEAARVDGASKLRQFKVITLPMISPALLFSLITGLIGSFQVFTQAFIMTAGGPGDSTRFYMLHLYNQAFVSLRMGYASALAWMLFGIVFVLTLVQLRTSKWVYSEVEGR